MTEGANERLVRAHGVFGGSTVAFWTRVRTVSTGLRFGDDAAKFRHRWLRGLHTRQILPDVRERSSDDSWYGEQHQRTRREIRPHKTRDAEGPGKAPGRQREDKAEHRRGQQHAKRPGAAYPEHQQAECAENVAPAGAGEKRRRATARLRSIEPVREQHARQREPREDNDEEHTPVQRTECVERCQKRCSQRGNRCNRLFGWG